MPSKRKKIQSLIAIILFTAFGIVTTGIASNQGAFINADEYQSNSLLASANPARVYFTAPTDTYEINDTINMEINLDTGGASIYGYTLRIAYNPSMLSPINTPPVTWGTLPGFPGAVLDTNGTMNKLVPPERVHYEQITMAPFNGSGLAGTLSFKAIGSGSTSVTCYKDPANSDPNYDYSSAGDCDVVSTAVTDVMGGLTPLDLIITGGEPPQQIIAQPAVSGIAQTTANVTWATQYTGSSTVKYGTTTAYGSTATGSSSTNHSVGLANLSPDTLYHYQTSATNSSYTPATITSADATFRTLPLPPPLSQEITSVPTVTNITQTSATINWETRYAGTTTVEYGNSISYGNNATDNTSTNKHSITFGNISSGTLVHYRVKTVSANPAGTVSSADATFRTLPKPVVIAPPVYKPKVPIKKTTPTKKPVVKKPFIPKPTTKTTPVKKPATPIIDSSKSIVFTDKTKAIADGKDSIKINIILKDANGNVITATSAPTITITSSDTKADKITPPVLEDNVWISNIASTSVGQKTIAIGSGNTPIGQAIIVNFERPLSILSLLVQKIQSNRNWVMPMIYLIGLFIIILCLRAIYHLTRPSGNNHESPQDPPPVDLSQFYSR